MAGNEGRHLARVVRRIHYSQHGDAGAIFLLGLLQQVRKAGAVRAGGLGENQKHQFTAVIGQVVFRAFRIHKRKTGRPAVHIRGKKRSGAKHGN